MLMTLASAISAQVLTAALAMLRTFLRDNPWEHIVPLARQFREVLECFLMDRVEQFLAAQPDTDERQAASGQTGSAWTALLVPALAPIQG